MVRLSQTEEQMFIGQTIYIWLRLIENHDHADLLQSRKEEIRFVSRLFDKFPNCWLKIGRDFGRLFQHLFPLEGLDQYWGLIDNDEKSTTLVSILNKPTHPRVLQVCISPQEQRDLMVLCDDVMVCHILRYLCLNLENICF